MLRSVRLQNFRSLRDTGDVELRPIVLLVGANSTGKSSFLRFFPLLRQTAEEKTSGPLLWYRDQGYVDFGDFRHTLFRGAQEPIIEFSAMLESREHAGIVNPEKAFRVRIGETGGHSRVQRFDLSVWGDALTLRPSTSPAAELARLRTPHALPGWWSALPTRFDGLMPEFDDDNSLADFGTDLLTRLLWEKVHGNTSDERLFEIAGQIVHGPSADVLQSVLEAASVANARTLLQNIQGLTAEDTYVAQLRQAAFVRDVEARVAELRSDWRDFSLGVRYIGPFRSDPARFYRKEEIAVGEIARRGDNLAMFMHSLEPPEAAEFSAFVREHFGFGVSASTEGSHVVLKVDSPTRDGADYNLVDMGYGISQLLPVVAQCWIADRAWAGGHRSRWQRRPSLLAIEQPELHLHPHHQYRLADMFADLARAISTDRRVVPIVVETHSEAMIHRFGELVEAGRLRPEDINVLLFEKPDDAAATTVRRAEFDATGVLQNWPLGFFRR